MPTYTYECTNCGEREDVVQSIHNAPLEDCPKCLDEYNKKGTYRKVINSIAFSLKGPGFHVNDYTRRGR